MGSSCTDCVLPRFESLSRLNLLFVFALFFLVEMCLFSLKL
jgi:hypothetical protein